MEKARPEERLKAPIGCGAGGNLISLDVHEKFHGPHGLIAGTTGSGKVNFYKLIYYLWRYLTVLRM